MGNLPLNFHFKDAVLPEEIYIRYKQLKQYEDKLSSCHIIIDPNVFYNLLKDIEYYYKRNLITDEELDILKKELLEYLSFFESTARNSTETGPVYNWYISSLGIDFNSSFCIMDGHLFSSFYVHSINGITLTDPEACSMHRQWLYSLRKYATLVSGSNESQLADFCNKQMQLIESM